MKAYQQVVIEIAAQLKHNQLFKCHYIEFVIISIHVFPKSNSNIGINSIPSLKQLW